MRLKVTSFGQAAEGIQLTGNPKSCEPPHVRIAFPGGDIEVVRAADWDQPDYWVHVRVNRPDDGHHDYTEEMTAKITDARLDQIGKNAADSKLGDFNNPGLYHVAVRVRPDWKGKR